MLINKISLYIILLFTAALLPSCKKYLEKKPDKALAVPQSLQDLQALLDNWINVNDKDPSSSVQSADDFYLTDEDYKSLSEDADKKMYIWGRQALYPSFPNDWSYQYDIINIANTVLDNIGNIERTSSNASDWDNVKGQALLFRARSFQLVAWQWANAYTPATAGKDLGIPLRLHSDFNEPSVRASLQDTYDRIIADYKESVPLLPVTPLHVLRPSRPAAYGLLARTYLSIGNFTGCSLYADSCLALFSSLLDYNTLDTTRTYPVRRFNAEVIMSNRIPVPNMFTGTKARIDTLLYQSYSDSDLRKSVFFRDNGGYFNFRGSYEGSSAMFSGIATDEVVLMKAECLARNGNAEGAMAALNSLLTTRWKSGLFVPYTATNDTDALNKVLAERRKELVMRGWRWMDIKRLNILNANIIMHRTAAGQTYTLLPNDLRYEFPIPDDVIKLSGMQQNPY